jgi:amidase
LKPSRGRVPLGPAVGEAVGGFAHEFAVTRSVRDAAALLDAINGPAPGDRYYVAPPAAPFSAGVSERLPPLRIAVHTTTWFGTPTEPAAEAAVQATAATLAELGHEVEEACPEVAVEALRNSSEVVWSVDLAMLAASFARITGREPGPDTVEAASWACIQRGREISALELEAAASAVNSASRRWGRFLDEWDLFLCPTTPTAAPPSGVPDQDDAAIETATQWIDAVFALSPFTPLTNLTGQPSISLPLGESDDGMPLGVMLTAQTLREDLLLRVAAVLEQAVPWAQRRPPVVVG